MAVSDKRNINKPVDIRGMNKVADNEVINGWYHKIFGLGYFFLKGGLKNANDSQKACMVIGQKWRILEE